MQSRVKLGLLVGLGLVAAQVMQAVILPPPPAKTVRLSWNYPENPDIVFCVYQTSDPSLPRSQWTLVTNLAERACVLPMNANERFYTVVASNVVTRIQSH